MFEKKIPFLHFMTNFQTFALTIEPGWAKRMVKPILETNDANDVSMYVWFIHSCMKMFKKDTMLVCEQ